jgi:hypothetical protein
MAIFRINKTKDYTTMSNYHLRDTNLSLKAKGMLSLMLSLPEDWDYSVRGLEQICKEAKNTINDVLKELEQNNYLVRKRIYTNGKISDWEYNIFERNDLHRKNQDIENQDIENCDINKIYNNIYNNIYNTKELNTKEYKEIQKKDDLFEFFWKTYPKKLDKGRVEKWFSKNKPSKELVDLMIKQVERFKQTEQWKKEDGKYIPYPATWLNSKCWEDEFETEVEKEERMLKEIEEKYKEV